MATNARAQKAVGSSAWIAKEKENMMELVDQEMEEVEYPVRHEMDWLNEHMNEIFSKGQAHFTDVFKTPGKMRGKTPRTARKRNVEENRVPLSEIFSSAHKPGENRASHSPFIHRIVSKSTAPTASATRPNDAEKPSQPQYPDLSQNLNSFQKYNTDSGYHGMEYDNDTIMSDPLQETDTQGSTQPFEVHEPVEEHVEEHVEEPVKRSPQVDLSVDQHTVEESFHSAEENLRARGQTVEPMNMVPTDIHEQSPRPVVETKESEAIMSPTPATMTDPTPRKASATPPKERDHSPAPTPKAERQLSNHKSSPEKTPAPRSPGQESQDYDMHLENTAKRYSIIDNFDNIGSPSDNSTPERPLVRKSSLSFASLPAREPLAKSLGGSRLSRTSHIDLPKLSNGSRASYLQRVIQPSTEAIDVDDEKASKRHNTKSTQSLHERISMLGKQQPTRPRKSIPTIANLSSGGHIVYPELPSAKTEARPEHPSQKAREAPDPEPTAAGEDDWIKPLSSPPQRVQTKSKTPDVVDRLFDTERYQPTIKKETYTAQPERPRSAASLFASPRPKGHQSSASVSHIPSLTTTPTGSPRRFEGPLSASKLRLQSIMKTAKGLFTSTGSPIRFESTSPEQTRSYPQKSKANVDDNDDDNLEARPHSPPRQETRRTRSSTEKEEKRRQKELEDRQQEDEARQEEEREQEKQRLLQLKAAQDKSSIEPEERPVTATQKPTHLRQPSREPEHQGSRLVLPQKHNDRRPKPIRELLQKPQPQPVSIRVGSTLSRQIAMPSSMSSSVQESSVAPPVSKAPTLKKKGSNNSLYASSNSLKSSVSGQTQAQRKPQLAHERKKEQEEREARRREEQKREHERKRAAMQQQEEVRRQEMRSRSEAERERKERSAQEDSKKAAHMQAIEKRRLENARRHERQGSQPINDAPMLQHEKTASQSSQRNDLGANRPASRLGLLQSHGRSINPPAPNPAKPLKRPVTEEDAGTAGGHSADDSKRRKTEDEHNTRQAVRPAMKPPIRKPSIRNPSLFGQSSVSGSSIFKPGGGQPQRPPHPMDLSKYANGKIPFAEPSHAPPPAAHKPTLGSAQRAPPLAKPSPQYQNGENIHLPEIATDSEDEDDSDSEMFPVPKWAQPKELEGLLRQQDGMEVDSIFGPIAPFSLEETFKADKKIKKYRDRTSSANWSGPDGLTQEEIHKDRAGRQRLRMNGGWSFNT
ncbi:hypothetical protein N7495_009195 [Penicillium taxi]|uniref:uncharacterized protein n=1 Tax=Penicillium taxi TaxID=168475 RepID=UPI002544E7E6|nr:uncharacterized protein N7495_009195 [Penicillium taxi]KAJ5884685.1 hypothetical protein N7495_009195 [Penicillium taxi]